VATSYCNTRPVAAIQNRTIIVVASSTLANPLTSLLKRSARIWPSAVLARRRGARFLLHPQNWIDNRIFVGAPFEVEQISAAKHVIETRGIDLVVDIGANIGLYTVLLGVMPQVANVISFEPVRRNFAQLMGNIFVNGLSAKVDAHRLALAEKAGSAVIHIDPRSTGVSRLDLSTAERAPDAFAETEEITITVFDEVCALKGRKAFVKIDVEGGAVGVLSGMRNFLAGNDVVLQVELSDAERAGVLELLAAAGFTLQRQIEQDAIFSRA
jgi:FkbM family methyltransferase